MRSFVPIALLLATAAFSECGPRPVWLVIEGPEQVQGEVVGDSLRCAATLTAGLGSQSDRRQAEWSGTYIAFVDPSNNVQLSGYQEDAGQTAAHWGSATVGADSTLTATYTLVIPRGSMVQMTFLYRTVNRGSVTESGPAGATPVGFRCAAREE